MRKRAREWWLLVGCGGDADVRTRLRQPAIGAPILREVHVGSTTAVQVHVPVTYYVASGKSSKGATKSALSLASTHAAAPGSDVASVVIQAQVAGRTVTASPAQAGGQTLDGSQTQTTVVHHAQFSARDSRLLTQAPATVVVSARHTHTEQGGATSSVRAQKAASGIRTVRARSAVGTTRVVSVDVYDDTSLSMKITSVDTDSARVVENEQEPGHFRIAVDLNTDGNLQTLDVSGTLALTGGGTLPFHVRAIDPPFLDNSYCGDPPNNGYGLNASGTAHAAAPGTFTLVPGVGNIQACPS